MRKKNSIDELAIFTGKPAFARPLHVGGPNIGNRPQIIHRLEDILDRRWLTNNGTYVQQLEAEIQSFTGAKHCIATCNATVGLEIAIRALGFTGEVIVPAFTFVATAHSLAWQGLTPVFCDVDAETHHIDTGLAEKLITPRTSGIVAVHLWGRACDVESLCDLAHRHSLGLLFDAAHAFGCSRRGKMVGGFGDAEVFSFHATKFFNSFEGGAITTNNDKLAERMRLMRNFGFTDVDQVDHLGTNGKMTEICAAMGLTNLESLPSFLEINRRNYEIYNALLARTPGLKLIRYDLLEKCNFQYIVVEVDQAEAGINRDHLVQILRAENIIARRYFFPGCHRMKPYQDRQLYEAARLPNTERLSEQVIVLPTGSSVRPADIDHVCSLIRLVVQKSISLQPRLTSASAANLATAA